MTTDVVAVIGAGQSGLAAARSLSRAGVTPVIVEAGARASGSWPHYYDNLKAFSPAKFSAMPGQDFDLDPDVYPGRDDVGAYLEKYAAGLGVEILLNTRVQDILAHGRGFVLHGHDGSELTAAGVVSASGSFGTPQVPAVPGMSDFAGQILHSADYRNPAQLTGKRVVVVGGGNSAVQIGYELSLVTAVTLASHAPIRFLSSMINDHDVHQTYVEQGFDALPLSWLLPSIPGTLVLGNGVYEAAIASGQLPRRPMFVALDHDHVVWPDGSRSPADVVIFATGYRHSLPYLEGLGALDDAGFPLHNGGLSTTVPGLTFLGLEFQRSFVSNTLRGVSRDADHITEPLRGWVRNAPSIVGL